MKGPGLRIDVDVRRVWRCSRCGRVTRRLGDVTAQRCECSDGGTWMKLEGAPPLRTFPPRAPIPRNPADVSEDSESSVVANDPPVVTDLPIEPASDERLDGNGADLS